MPAYVDTSALVKRYVDACHLLNERQIADGMVHLYRQDRVIAEGGGALEGVLHCYTGTLRLRAAPSITASTSLSRAS